jgi:hypothetical protein
MEQGKRLNSLRLGLVLAICLGATPFFGQNTTSQQTPPATPAPSSGPEDTQGPAQTTPQNGPEDTQGPSTTPAKPAPTNAPAQSSATAANPVMPAPKPDPGPKVNADGVVQGVRPGSIEDVNAVGTRDIGGRGMGNWYSTETEIREGKAYSMEIEKSVRFVNDPVVTEYINRIGQNLVKNSDAKVPFTIKVIDDDSINAMALPGGFFYVNSGAILAADEEAELAGVMAHEISHVAAHHAMREQTRLNYAQLGTIPLIMIGG